MSSVIPLDKNGGSEEKNAQVEILIYHLLKALRGVYKKTGIVDNPVFTVLLQVYIVTGGYGTYGSSWTQFKSTETLEKDGGSAWQLVASLPSGRGGFRGLGLDHGRFIVTGECRT